MSEIEDIKLRYRKYLERISERQKRPIELSGFYSSTRNNPAFIKANHISHEGVVKLIQESLIDLSDQYKAERTQQQFENDVLTLQQIIEKSDYSDCLIDGKFKISHAQKSLSVYLKYLWCKDSETYHQPPASPVDSNVLCRLGWPICRENWTRMDENRYHQILDLLLKRAERENRSIAEMELCWFDEMIVNKQK